MEAWEIVLVFATIGFVVLVGIATAIGTFRRRGDGTPKEVPSRPACKEPPGAPPPDRSA